jgi:hypothetical protein
VVCERGSPDNGCSCPFGGGEWEGLGCSCYLHKIVGGGGGGDRMNWLEAQDFCASVGARMATIRSGEENDWIEHIMKKATIFGNVRLPAFIGLNTIRDGTTLEWGYFENWRSASMKASAAEDKGVSQGSCAQIAQSGEWVRSSCDVRPASCFVCKRERAGIFAGVRPYHQEQWDVEVESSSTEQDGHWCDDCFRVYLKHAQTGQYLAADAQNLLYMSTWKDPTWCVWTLVVHPPSGGMALMTPHGAVLHYDGLYGLYCAVPDSPTPTSLFHRYENPTNSSRPLRGKWGLMGKHLGIRGNGHRQLPFGNGRGGGQLKMGHPRAGPRSQDQLWSGKLQSDDIAIFTSDEILGQIAWKYLRISVVARSRDLNKPGVKECSVLVFDPTPQTKSYACYYRNTKQSAEEDLVYLEQEALLFFDESTYATPRIPLPNGRVRCENGSPTETATCTFAYGQGLTLSRQFRANWGYTISDVITHRVNAQAVQTALFRVLPRPRSRDQKLRNKVKDMEKDFLDHKGKKNQGGTRRPTVAPQVTDLTISANELAEFANSFSVAYNNFYEILITKSYVETRNWQMSVPVAPRTTDTIQFWLASENLQYRWRALFAARGGFKLSAFGKQIGSHHSLSDLTYFRDLFFFIFGVYSFPYEAEIIITVNDRPGQGWPLPIPEESQGERIKDVVHNGQLGWVTRILGMLTLVR